MLVGIVTLIISVVVVFNHQLVWLLAVFPGLYIAYAYFLAFAKPPELSSDIQASLTSEESAAWGQFHVFLRFGMAAPAMSRTLTILQVLSVITGIALAVTGLYWGLLIALGWFVLAPLTPRLNPVLYLSDAAKRGNLEAQVQLESLESLYEKLQSPNKLALNAKGDVQTSTGLKNLHNNKPSDESYADTIVKVAESSVGALRDRFKCTDAQSAQAAVQLAGISLVVVGRRLKQDGVDEETRQRLLKELMSKVANNTSISPAQPKAELLAMVNEYRWFMSSPLSREAADELTRHGFIVMIAKTIAGDDEVSARSRAGVAVDKMVSLGWSANLSKLESSL